MACFPAVSWTTAQWVGWLYIGIATLCYILFAFYAPTAANYQYTFQVPGMLGILQSQRWSFDFFVTGSISWLVLIPVSMACVLANPTSTVARTFHVVVGGILGVWFTATCIFGFINLANANKIDPTNYFNPFNSDRWCLNNGAPGLPCFVTSSTSNDPLFPNGTAQYELWWRFSFLFIIAAGIMIATGIITPAAKAAEMEGDNTAPIKAALLPSKTRRSKK